MKRGEKKELRNHRRSVDRRESLRSGRGISGHFQGRRAGETMKEKWKMKEKWTRDKPPRRWKKTRADTLGIHLILPFTGPKRTSGTSGRRCIKDSSDIGNRSKLLLHGPLRTPRAPHHAGVSTTVHDSTTFRHQLRLALFTLLRPCLLQPLSTTTILFFSPCLAPFLPPFPPPPSTVLSSSCRFSSKVTASNDRPRERSRFRFTQSTPNKYETQQVLDRRQRVDWNSDSPRSRFTTRRASNDTCGVNFHVNSYFSGNTIGKLEIW